MKIEGAILAGGMGMRMGGADKPLLNLGGTPLVGHVIARFGPQVEGLVINANGDPARFAAFAHEVIADREGPGGGPLAGLAAVLERGALSPSITHVATVPADTPLIPPDLVRRLAEALFDAGPAAVAIAASGGRSHPVIGLWPVGLSAALNAHLAAGKKRSMQAFLGGLAVHEVEFPLSGGADPFLNVNTPADLEQATSLLRSGRILPPRG